MVMPKKNKSPLSDREVLVEFLKTKNLTKTAKALNLHPSTISRSLTSLEHHLNTKLFEKIDGKVQLTQEGIIYGDFIKNKILKIKIFEESMINNYLDIDIIASEWFLINIVTPAISENIPNKNLKINLIASNNLNCMENTKPTIFIGTGRQNKKSDAMSLKSISEVALGLYAHKDCEFIDFRKTYTPNDLENMNLVNVVDGNGMSVIRFQGRSLPKLKNSFITTDNLQSSFEEGMKRKCPFVACPTITMNALSQNQCSKIKTSPDLDKIHVDVIFSKNENENFIALARKIHSLGKKILHVSLPS